MLILYFFDITDAINKKILTQKTLLNERCIPPKKRYTAHFKEEQTSFQDQESSHCFINLNSNNVQQKLNNLVDFEDFHEDLDVFQIVQATKTFLTENKINTKKFSEKVLYTNHLVFKILIDFPHEWITLNSIFKMYYLKLFRFLNDQNKVFSFVKHSDNILDNRDNNIEYTDNMIMYDISQTVLNYEPKILTNWVIEKLSENGLNKRILCDAVLGTPLNRFNVFFRVNHLTCTIYTNN